MFRWEAVENNSTYITFVTGIVFWEMVYLSENLLAGKSVAGNIILISLWAFSVLLTLYFDDEPLWESREHRQTSILEYPFTRYEDCPCAYCQGDDE